LSQHELISNFLSKNFQSGLEEFVWFEETKAKLDEDANIKNIDFEVMSLLMHQLGESKHNGID
jgi:hypothetical protein